MTIMQSFLNELEKEAVTTRKMLERVPLEQYDWAPHEKSMKLGTLATHVAELPAWIEMVLNTDELDFEANPYKPEHFTSTNELLSYFEKCLTNCRKNLTKENETQLELLWTLRNGNQIYSTEPKADVIRMSLSQIIHHRAQLGVYLRLLNIPIPGSYGPSADENNF